MTCVLVACKRRSLCGSQILSATRVVRRGGPWGADADHSARARRALISVRIASSRSGRLADVHALTWFRHSTVFVVLPAARRCYTSGGCFLIPAELLWSGENERTATACFGRGRSRERERNTQRCQSRVRENNVTIFSPVIIIRFQYVLFTYETYHR